MIFLKNIVINIHKKLNYTKRPCYNLFKLLKSKKELKMVRRVFVEKMKGFDVEAKGLFEDIKNNLDISGLKDIRVINRYDVEGLDEATYINAKTTVFSEPAIDMVYDEKLPENIGVNVFATAYLPGQYDQRADSAVQCIKLIN